MVHETLWITQDVRTTATPRDGTSAPRVELARGGAPGAGVGELGVAVAGGLAARRRRGPRPQARAWAPAQVDRPATHAVGAAVGAGGQSRWLSQRAMDLEADGGGDSGGVWPPLSSRPCLEALMPP